MLTFYLSISVTLVTNLNYIQVSRFIQAEEKTVELLSGTGVTRNEFVSKPGSHDIYNDGNLDVCNLKAPVIGEVVGNPLHNLLPGLPPTFLALSQVVWRKNASSAINYTESDILL